MLAGAGMIPGRNMVTYRVGRFYYVFSFKAKKWAILETKDSAGEASELTDRSGDGKLIVSERDVIHFYSARSGDWTHLDTTEKEGK